MKDKDLFAKKEEKFTILGGKTDADW